MKTLEINLNGFPHPNSLMLPTWYLISTSHIPPSLVLSHCPEHTVAVVLCLCIFPMGISFINFLVYSVCLFSLTLSFHALFRVSFKTSNFFLILAFLTHTFNSQKIKILLKKKQETTNLIGGRRWSSLFLTFSGAILGPLLFISILLLPALFFRALSLLHCSPNPLQLSHTPLLVLHQVLEGLFNSSVLLHKLPECLFNDIQDPTISRDHGQGISMGVGYIPLLESDAPSTCERLAMKKEIIKNNNNKYNKNYSP